MVNVIPAVDKATLQKVNVRRQTALSGGLLKKTRVLPTNRLRTGHGDVEFVQLQKGEQWLVHAECGPLSRQRGLARTKMVDDLIIAAIVAADGPTSAAVDEPARDATPQPRDLMSDLSCGEGESQSHRAGDSCDTPKKQPR